MPWRKVNGIRGSAVLAVWRGKKVLTANGTSEQTPGTSEQELCSSVGKSSRQKEPQVQSLWCWHVLGVFEEGMSVCQKRSAEEVTPSRITLQTKLRCKITLCCLDITEVETRIKPYYKNDVKYWLRWTFVEGSKLIPPSYQQESWAVFELPPQLVTGTVCLSLLPRGPG